MIDGARSQVYVCYLLFLIDGVELQVCVCFLLLLIDGVEMQKRVCCLNFPLDGDEVQACKAPVLTKLKLWVMGRKELLALEGGGESGFVGGEVGQR